MAPAAQQYYVSAMSGPGVINLRKAKELEYGGAGNLAKVMDVSAQYGGGTGGPQSLDVNIPVQPMSDKRMGGALGRFASDISGRGGTLLINTESPFHSRSPYNFLDTVAHEATHAVENIRGVLGTPQFLKDYLSPAVPEAAVPTKNFLGQRYDTAAHELRAGPVHAMKAYMVNKTGKIPTTPREAEQQIRQFQREYKDPSKSFPTYYPSEYWRGLFRSPATPTLYLQTVKAPGQSPSVPRAPLSTPASPSQPRSQLA